MFKILKLLILTGLFAPPLFLSAQVQFEPGYLLTSDGDTLNVLIENSDWANNPSHFKYRKTPSSPVETGTPTNVKGFSVGTHQYISYLGPIDYSSAITEELSYEKKPDYQLDSLFLRNIINGPNTLYHFKDGLFNRFFINVQTDSIIPLEYKKYKVKEPDGTERVAENNKYKNQLKALLPCEEITPKIMKKLAYRSSALSKLVIMQNYCGVDKPKLKDVRSDKKTWQWRLHPRIGIAPYTMTLTNDIIGIFEGPYDFGSGTTWRAGAMLELVFPFNKNKWSATIEPSIYNSYEARATITENLVTQNPQFTHQAYDINIGIRYYMFFNEKSGIYLHPGYSINFGEFNLEGAELDDFFLLVVPGAQERERQANRISIGFGGFYDRISLEFQYLTKKEFILDKGWEIEQAMSQFILGYRLFK